MKPVIQDRILSDFRSHQADCEGQAKMATVRESLGTQALLIERTVPFGREQQLALTKLEEAMFWANAGISRQFPVVGSPVGEKTGVAS